VLLDVAYGGDITYGIGTTLTWAMAQISTGIIVACCPYLRPLFEKVLPHKLTRVPAASKSASTPTPRKDLEKASLDNDGEPEEDSQQTTQQLSPTQTRNDSIIVTTTIKVHPSAPSPNIKPVFHDDHRAAPWAPTTKVEAKHPQDLHDTPEPIGCLRRCSCC